MVARLVDALAHDRAFIIKVGGACKAETQVTTGQPGCWHAARISTSAQLPGTQFTVSPHPTLGAGEVRRVAGTFSRQTPDRCHTLVLVAGHLQT